MELFKKILRIAFWGILITGLVTVFAFMQKKESELLCSSVTITIERNPQKENFLVEEGAVRQLIASQFGQVENIPLKNIDVNFLERILYTNPWVYRADVSLTINGRVDIVIEQREPVLRIINRYGESYFIDSHGRLMPWSPDFTPRTLIATGNIPESYTEWNATNVAELINNDTLKTRTLLDDFYAMARFILADEFWSAHVEQIYLNNHGEMELVPKVGDHKIIFGNSGEMEEKFWKLKTFYTEGLNYTGWDRYDTLNLQFNNQVVCTKKNYKPSIRNSNNTSPH